jgi:phosphoribosyl 1,2-cyclic phosphodiesterase
VLASGSAGNSTFVSTSRTRVLIDAGLSVKELTRRLAEIGEKPEDLDAILITHEHSDHISGLPRLVRSRAKQKKPVAVFVSRLTAPMIDWEIAAEKQNGRLAMAAGAGGGQSVAQAPPVEHFQAGSDWMVGDIKVQSFGIPHDAEDPVGFCLEAEGVKIGIATDLGYVPDSIKYHLRGVHFLLFESNHAIEMLKVGPYPWSVKQRVMSRKGHLSNDTTCDYIENDLEGSVQALILGHLSEQNNHPVIVRQGAEMSLERRGIRPRLAIAEQKKQTEVFTY